MTSASSNPLSPSTSTFIANSGVAGFSLKAASFESISARKATRAFRSLEELRLFSARLVASP